MNDPSRQALLEALLDLCDRYPHWRLGQIVSNVAGWADVDLWDIEDEQLLAAARSHIEHLRAREPLLPKGGSAAPTARL